MAILEVMNDMMVGGEFFGVLVSCRSSFPVDGYIFFLILGISGFRLYLKNNGDITLSK